MPESERAARAGARTNSLITSGPSIFGFVSRGFTATRGTSTLSCRFMRCRELCRDRLPSVAAQLLRAPSRPGQRGARPGRGGEAAATRRLGSETTQALRGAQLAQEEAQEAPAYPSQVRL